jgi:hypothetical protein
MMYRNKFLIVCFTVISPVILSRARYYIISPSLTPDDFSCQGENAGTQWVKQRLTRFKLTKDLLEWLPQKLSTAVYFRYWLCFDTFFLKDAESWVYDNLGK